MRLGTKFIATVMILDDDHAGVFTFDQDQVEVAESEPVLEVAVKRYAQNRAIRGPSFSLNFRLFKQTS